MKKLLPPLVKRLLALALALVLLLSLCPTLPLTADAAVESAGWEYNTSYSKYYTTVQFYSADADLSFEDDQPYDWEVLFEQSYSKLSPTITATVADSTGKQIGDTVVKSQSLEKSRQYTILRASDFTALTTDLFGEFTVTMEMYNGATFMAKMTKKFSRVSTNPLSVSVTSRSNPDKVFTFADPIDLVLRIKKNDGIAAAYNAALTVTNGSGTELLAARNISLPASTNITLNVKDLVDLPSITTAGTYKLNLTLTDSNGAIQHQSSADFAVVALAGSVTASVTSATSSNLAFDNAPLDLVVNLKKTDGIAETFKTAITITNSSGSTVFSNTFETDVPANGTATITPSLGDLAKTGTFYLTATVTDDAGNLRGSTSATFTRTSSTPMTCNLTDLSPANTGRIYHSGSDFNLQLRITHQASANQTVTIKAIGTLNGEAFECSTTKKLDGAGTATVTINGAMLASYGVFEDIYIAVFAPNGNQLWKSANTYSFSRALATAGPGDLPILNINDHFTSGKGDGSLKVPLAAQAGANMWRACIPWATIEKSKGSYNISVVKSVMDTTKSNGMQALVILAYNNDLYGSANPTDSTWLNAYANYCYYVADMMAQYYPDQVVGFEIWNEWNHATMSKVPAQYRTGAHYAAVVKAASAKIKQVNQNRGTNFKVIAGAVSGNTTNEGTETFVRAMLGVSGLVDAIDGFSFHTYATNETTTINDRLQDQRRFERVSPAEFAFSDKVADVKRVLKEHNVPDRVEIWLTETGWATNAVQETTPPDKTSDGKTHITTGATEEEAAAYMVQLYTWALADDTLDRIFWYDFMNDLSDASDTWTNNNSESNYGLIHNWNNSGNQPLAYSAKQGYVAMCALSSKLGGATYKGTVSLGSGVEAYSFTDRDGKTMVVAWTTGNTTKTLRCSGSMTVTDMYGNATGNLTSATLSECPIYIACDPSTLSIG